MKNKIQVSAEFVGAEFKDALEMNSTEAIDA
jgi:hypothetical protein